MKASTPQETLEPTNLFRFDYDKVGSLLDRSPASPLDVVDTLRSPASPAPPDAARVEQLALERRPDLRGLQLAQARSTIETGALEQVAVSEDQTLRERRGIIHGEAVHKGIGAGEREAFDQM